MVAQMLKQAGKRTWRLEHVVRATGGDGMAGGALTTGLKVVVQLLVSPQG
jgi:hypothetical protein